MTEDIETHCMPNKRLWRMMRPLPVPRAGRSSLRSSHWGCLGKCSQFEVVSLLPLFPTMQELGAMEPDAILLDVEADSPAAAFALLESCPGLLLIGVSPDSNQTKVWTRRQLCELSTEDLVQAITDLEFSFSDSRGKGGKKISLGKYYNDVGV